MAHKTIPVASFSSIKRQVLYEGGQRTIHSQQNVTPILDANQKLRGHIQMGTEVGGFKLAARVPDILWYVEWPQEFLKQTGMRHNAPEARQEYRDFIVDKLHDRDFSKLRVDESRFK